MILAPVPTAHVGWALAPDGRWLRLVEAPTERLALMRLLDELLEAPSGTSGLVLPAGRHPLDASPTYRRPR